LIRDLASSKRPAQLLVSIEGQL